VASGPNTAGNEILWRPDAGRIERALLSRFVRALDLPYAPADDYAGLHRWSLAEVERFWRAVWSFCTVQGEPGDCAVEGWPDFQRTRFFPGGRLNFAANLLERRGEPAIIAAAEDRPPREIGREQLRGDALAFAGWLRAQGVGPGDRVAALLPNVPETVIAMLGASAIGAVFASASPDFGEQGVVDRFGPIEPAVLLVADGYRYKGRLIDIRAKAEAVARRLPGLRRVVGIDFAGLGLPAGALPWDEAIATPAPDFQYPQLPFDHPLYIVFSSGTTGPPKCIVHRAGGVLLQHLKEQQLHCDIRPGDRVLYFTTCGWMMWNWLVSALASAATIVLYDGAPAWPGPGRLFELAESVGLSFFGTSAKFIDSLRKQAYRPADHHELATIRTLASTGSPLLPESFDYVYEAVGRDLLLASISGGTDLLGCFVGANPCGPVRRGEIQAPMLGMAVEVWNEAGQRVRETRGELVCTRPFPSVPLGFWQDAGGRRFRAAYFERFPGVWAHGDFAVETRHGGFRILGRSDAVLNPGGVRIGTAEIYRQVETLDEVIEAVAVGQERDGDQRVLLFVVLRPGCELDEALRARIRRRIRDGASPRHVPARILAVSDIPRTRSGKLAELAVRDVVHGREPGNLEALANPEALADFRDRPELAD